MPMEGMGIGNAILGRVGSKVLFEEVIFEHLLNEVSQKILKMSGKKKAL